MKIKWRSQPAPTGRYRSFEKRGWPHAEYENGKIAASIECEDEYIASNVKTGSHGLLTVRVADYSVTPWQWRKVKVKFETVEQAKAAVSSCLHQFSEFKPK